MSEVKNIKRNIHRQSVNRRPYLGGSGFGGRLYFPTSNLTEYERWELRKGLY